MGKELMKTFLMFTSGAYPGFFGGEGVRCIMTHIISSFHIISSKKIIQKYENNFL